MKFKGLIIVFFSFISISFSQNKDTLFLYYDINEFSINDKNKLIISNFLSFNDILSVEIVAYTDFLGSSFYNQELSQKRAEVVYNYLLNKGFPKNNIIFYHGLGVFPKSHLFRSDNETIIGVPSHRRTEIIYVKKENKASETLSFLDINDFDIGQEIVLENIIFIGGTPNFKAESAAMLQDLVKIMQQYPTLAIEIQGHICCKDDGEDGYDIINQNNFLSLNRAKAVYDFLIKAGIDSTRMIYKGYGSSKKRFPQEKTTYEEDLNRRVEIKILNK